jgi:O-antigen/teichoic acid export membrane protein
LKHHGLNILTVLLRQLMGAVVAMLTTVFLARNLSLSDNGLFASLSLLPVMAATIACLGSGPSVAYHISRNHFERTLIIQSSLLLGVLCAFTAAAILLLTLAFQWLPAELSAAATETRIAILTAIPILVFNNFSAALQGLQRFKEFGFLTITPPTLFLLALLLIHSVEPGLLTTRNAVIGFGSAYAASALIAIGYFRHSLIARQAAGLPSWGSCVRSIVSYGIKAHLANVLAILNYRLNYYIILALGGASNLGLFVVIAALCEALWMLSSAAGTIIFPLVASSPNQKTVTHTTLEVARWVLYLTSAAAVALLIIASNGWLTKILTEKYQPINVALYVLIPGIVSLAFARVLANDIAGRGHPMINTGIAAVSLAINTGINLVAIEPLGITGVAIASSLSYLALSGLTIVAYARITHLSLSEIVRPRASDLATAKLLLNKVLQGVRS